MWWGAGGKHDKASCNTNETATMSNMSAMKKFLLLAFYAIGIDSAVPNRPVGIYAVASILYGFIAAVWGNRTVNEIAAAFLEWPIA